MILIMMLTPITSSPGQSSHYRSNDFKFKRAKKLKISPISTVDSGSATRAAQLIRRGYFGVMIGHGAGESMMPVYGENSFFVIRPADFDSLTRGTMIAYRYKYGQIIIHQLIRKQGKKWMAQGLNNQVMDNEWVTTENIVGVVYAVFHSGS